MRKPTVLNALFSTSKQGILAATLMEPDRWWYLSDLARYLGVHHATLQRELTRLTRADLLLSRRDGNRAYFRANPNSPIFPELRILFAKTIGLGDVLRELLQPVAGAVRVAFVYGSVARGAEVSESDIDLMIIGDVSLKDLSPSIREAEDRLHRPVNPKVFRESEFLERLATGTPFIQRVLAEKKLFVMGGESDLERLAQRRANRGPQHHSTRNRRAAPRG